MKIQILVAASLFAMPASSYGNSSVSDRCKLMDAKISAHDVAPVKPERPPNAILLPNAHIEPAGPAVLMPSCRGEKPRRRRKNDYPLA